MPEWHQSNYDKQGSGHLKSIKTFYAYQNFRFHPTSTDYYQSCL